MSDIEFTDEHGLKFTPEGISDYFSIALQEKLVPIYNRLDRLEGLVKFGTEELPTEKEPINTAHLEARFGSLSQSITEVMRKIDSLEQELNQHSPVSIADGLERMIEVYTSQAMRKLWINSVVANGKG